MHACITYKMTKEELGSIVEHNRDCIIFKYIDGWWTVFMMSLAACEQAHMSHIKYIVYSLIL